MTNKRTWRSLKRGDPVYLPRRDGREEVVGTFGWRDGDSVSVWLIEVADITEIPDVDLDEIVASYKEEDLA